MILQRIDKQHSQNMRIFANEFKNTVGVAQLVRVPDCGSEGRGFESHLPPKKVKENVSEKLLLYSYI